MDGSPDGQTDVRRNNQEDKTGIAWADNQRAASRRVGADRRMTVRWADGHHTSLCADGRVSGADACLASMRAVYIK